MQEREKIDCRE